MNEFEKSITDFETVCGCGILIHDIAEIFTVVRNGKNVERLFELAPHRDHRVVFSPKCRARSLSPTPCVRHCVIKMRERIITTRKKLYFNHCPFGLFELAAPVFRQGSLVAIFFAGIWERPLEREKIRRLCTLLPIFAEGFVRRAEAVRELETRIDERDGFAFRQSVLSYINSNASRNVSVEAFAKHISLSVSRTCHKISAYLGKSFSELLIGARVVNARALLESTDCRIGEIAEMSGFNSPEHFIRTFKKIAGMTPNAYRRRKRGAIEKTISE